MTGVELLKKASEDTRVVAITQEMEQAKVLAERLNHDWQYYISAHTDENLKAVRQALTVYHRLQSRTTKTWDKVMKEVLHGTA